MQDITTPVIARIESIVASIPGWTPANDLLALFSLVYATADTAGDVIEIGSWCGRSSVVLGFAAALIGNTRVHCVDLFPERDDWHRNADGSYSISVQIAGRRFSACEEQTVWPGPYEKDIAPLYEKSAGTLEIFLDSVSRNGLADVVTAYRGTSGTFADVARTQGLKCKLAFIDGDHSYRAVTEDIRNAAQFLIPGGWICMDDAFCGNGGVDRAISEQILGSENYEMKQQLTRKLFIARRKR